MANLSELLKQASQNIARIVEMEKKGFTPSASGGMPPSGATAMPPDPSMGGGAPPGGAPPMDPSMAGGAPPMGDPSMMGAGDPAGGPPIIQLGAQDLMQMMQMMQQGGAPAPGGRGAGFCLARRLRMVARRIDPSPACENEYLEIFHEVLTVLR